LTAAVHIRESAVSGLFYPRDAETLRNEVRDLLARCSNRTIPGYVAGIIAPHAGYIYSGFTAAQGYSLVRGKRYETVIIVSPSHKEYFDGISLYAGDAYRTPFGAVPVNKGVRKELSLERHMAVDFHGHGSEHAIEVQLPFLQEVLRDLTIVPVVIGNQQRDLCLELGASLAGLLSGREILLVASSDLSHYHSRTAAENLDSVAISDIEAFDASKLLDDLAAGRAEACGGGPVAAVLSALHQNGIRNVEVLDYRTSGEVTGDNTQVVGYVSAVMYS
jgi:AmmeMemoRadiSam system protein B